MRKKMSNLRTDPDVWGPEDPEPKIPEENKTINNHGNVECTKSKHQNNPNKESKSSHTIDPPIW